MLLKVALVAAALAAVWQFVAIGGRTMAERWHRARSTSEFLDRTWAEVAGDPKPQARAHAPGRAPVNAAAPRPQARATPGTRPTEGHTEADRKALDRIVSEHVRD